MGNYWTDQILFLSFYLGYQDAARHLQKEWDVQPQSLDFAPHVGKHALVTVLNKGLLYQASAREAQRVCFQL